MADNYLNNTGLSYYHNRIKTIFPSKLKTLISSLPKLSDPT